jgi:hypothetical protein
MQYHLHHFNHQIKTFYKFVALYALILVAGLVYKLINQ